MKLMHLFKRSAAALLSAVFVLSACGGGNSSPSFSETGGGFTGGGSNPFNGFTPIYNPVVDLPNYASLMSTHPTVSEIDALIPDINAVGNAGAAGQISRGVPSTNTARYSGIIAADLSLTQAVAGRIDMSVNFNNSTFTATADNFTSFDVTSGITTFEEDLGGSISVPNGLLIGAAFAGTGAGTLTGSAGDTDVTVTLDGIFIDNGGQNLALATADGTFTNSAGTFDFGGGLLATDQ